MSQDVTTPEDASPAAKGPGRTAPRDPFRALLRLTERQGDVVRYRAGGESAYLINDPDLIRRVLAENAANYSKATFFNNVFKYSVADGLLTTEGERWRRSRRLMQPAFHRERLAALAEGMTEATLDMLERWERSADGDEVLDIAAQMSSLTMRITAGALFGFDVSTDADGLGRRVAEGLPLLIAPDKPAVQAALRSLEQLVDRIVEEHRREGPKEDLLSMLLEARDEETGDPMTPRELRDETITLLLAGYETTANNLAWTWYLLSQHEEVAEKLRASLKATLRTRPPTVEDLPNLKYARMVLDESLRLYPPAWILGRRALGDDDLGGHHIAAGSVVAISPYITHRHPRLWERPEEFDPERFDPAKTKPRGPFVYFPFGGGPRLCIGHNLALLEAQLILSTVAQRFRLELVPGTMVEPERLFVLRPRSGLPMYIRRA
jgi:cytochrome P450